MQTDHVVYDLEIIHKKCRLVFISLVFIDFGLVICTIRITVIYAETWCFTAIIIYTFSLKHCWWDLETHGDCFLSLRAFLYCWKLQLRKWNLDWGFVTPGFISGVCNAVDAHLNDWCLTWPFLLRRKTGLALHAFCPHGCRASAGNRRKVIWISPSVC